MQMPRTKTGLLKYVETLHWALERELTARFHEDTIPQLKSWIRRTEDHLDRVPDGPKLRRDALERALTMRDEESDLVLRFKNTVLF